MAADLKGIPLYLRSESGELLPVPEHAIGCPECGRAMRRIREHKWVCEGGPQLHGPLWSPAAALERLLFHWPLKLPERSRRAPRRVLNHVWRMVKRQRKAAAGEKGMAGNRAANKKECPAPQGV